MVSEVNCFPHALLCTIHSFVVLSYIYVEDDNSELLEVHTVGFRYFPKWYSYTCAYDVQF